MFRGDARHSGGFLGCRLGFPEQLPVRGIDIFFQEIIQIVFLTGWNLIGLDVTPFLDQVVVSRIFQESKQVLPMLKGEAREQIP